MKQRYRGAKFGRAYYRGRPGFPNRAKEIKFIFRDLTRAALRATAAFNRLSPALRQAAQDAAQKMRRFHEGQE